jgi:hypothetical protein
MKHLRLALILLLATGLLYNCAPKPLVYNTTYDFDINARFTDQKRYAWLPLPITSTIDPLSIERIKYYADAGLRSKGLVEVHGNPDFVIEAFIGFQSKLDTTGGPKDYGLYREGNLKFVFMNPQTRQLLWRGSTRVRIAPALEPAEKDRLISDAVIEILSSYPPPQK